MISPNFASAWENRFNQACTLCIQPAWRFFIHSLISVLDGSFSKSRFEDVLQSTRIKNQDSPNSLFELDNSLTVNFDERKKLAESKAFHTGQYVNTVSKSGKILISYLLKLLKVPFSSRSVIFKLPGNMAEYELQ